MNIFVWYMRNTCLIMTMIIILLLLLLLLLLLYYYFHTKETTIKPLAAVSDFELDFHTYI